MKEPRQELSSALGRRASAAATLADAWSCPATGAVGDLTAWKQERLLQAAAPTDPILASFLPGRRTTTFSRHALRKRFRTACKSLGQERLASLTIHHGRHTFISHSLAGGRTLAEVRNAAGHANVSVTSGYLHVVVDDEAVGNLFAHLE